jgi:hypothetical protein
VDLEESTEAGVLYFTFSGDVYELHYSVVCKGVYAKDVILVSL